MKREACAGLASVPPDPFTADPLNPAIDAGIDRVDEVEAGRHVPDHISARRIVQGYRFRSHTPEAVAAEREGILGHALQLRTGKSLHHGETVCAGGSRYCLLDARRRRNIAIRRRAYAGVVDENRVRHICQYARQKDEADDHDAESKSKHGIGSLSQSAVPQGCGRLGVQSISFGAERLLNASYTRAIRMPDAVYNWLRRRVAGRSIPR